MSSSTGVRELTVEDRVKKVLAAVPSSLASDGEVIRLAITLAQGGTPETQRIEQIADDIAGLNEQRAALRQKHTALREELEMKLAQMAAAVADL